MNPKVHNRYFLELVRAGLWGGQRPVQGSSTSEATKSMTRFKVQDSVDWGEVYQLAQEQAVVGLALQGVEELRAKSLELRAKDLELRMPRALLLQWIGEVQVIEQRNRAMNAFIAELIEKLRKADIHAVLVKGQGIAQCYEKPLWRTSGDVDLLLSDDNYEKAKIFLRSLGKVTEPEEIGKRHLAMEIDGWTVELHGKLHCGISWEVDRGLEEIRHEIFNNGKVREIEFNSSSMDSRTASVFLPEIECDVIYVFAHILQHFFKGGIGLRQICDWCRLLYTYRDSLNYELLESRIREMGLMTEWKAFGALTIEYLGFPKDSMPLLDSSRVQKFKRKAYRLMEFILEVGNFGHNRDASYMKYPYLVRKCFSMRRRIQDLCRHFIIFPLDSLKFFPYIMFNGIRSAIRGEG